MLETCSSPSGYWAEVAHTCADSCGLPDAAVLAVPGAPSCGSLAAVECQDTPFSTDQERANETLALLSQCCTGGDYQVTVTLVDGCATQIADSLPGGSSTGAFEQCLAAELAGRRLACATGLSCAGASLSGVQ